MATTASMGYVGSVVLHPSGGNKYLNLRATSCDFRVQQDITYPEVIDGKIDTTLYQLGPKVVGGTVAFPLVHEGSQVITATGVCNVTDTSIAQDLWTIAAQRDSYGRLVNLLRAYVTYSSDTAFTYDGCYVNTMTWTVQESNPVNVSVEIFGTALSTSEARTPGGDTVIRNMLSPARIVTWNDTEVIIFSATEGTGADSQVMVNSEQIREFTVTLNNNLDRIYTLNGQLRPQDLVTRKREVSGTLKLLGRNAVLGDRAYDNEKRASTQDSIVFGYSLGAKALSSIGSVKYWATALHSVIFNIEEMALSTGVFETTYNFRALGDCLRNFEATQLGTTNVALTNNPPTTYSRNSAGGGYGGSTAGNFPGWLP